MTEAKPKAHSAPLPLRAIGDERLAGLDLRVLACIAAHDRMSLKTGAGQGCWASHETLSFEVGCNYINLGKSIKKLGELGYIERSSPTFGDKRGHVYRVPAALYDREESLSFGKAFDRRQRPGKSVVPGGERADVGQTTNEPEKVVCQDKAENSAVSAGSPEQYISQSDERYSAETGKDIPLEEARLAARVDVGASLFSNVVGVSEALGLGDGGNGTSDGAQLAMFERGLKAGSFEGQDDLLQQWIEWLETTRETRHGEPEGGWAGRLLESAIEALSLEAFENWQNGEPRTVLPVDAMLGEQRDAIREQVAVFYRQADKPHREALARRAGLPPADLRGFIEGRVSLPIGKQMALRTAAKEAA